MVCTWLGELCYCSCLPVLPGPAWVLLSYVLHTFISGSVPERGRVGPGQGNPRISSVCFTPRVERAESTLHTLSRLELFYPNVAFSLPFFPFPCPSNALCGRYHAV